MLGSLHMLDKAILKLYKNNEGKYAYSYQFIKVVESTDMYIVEKYLRHSVLSGSFLRLCSSLWVGIQIDVHVFDAKFLHFVLCSHTERTAGDGENNDSSFHGWFWRNRLNEYLVKNANLTIQLDWHTNVTGKQGWVGGLIYGIYPRSLGTRTRSWINSAGRLATKDVNWWKQLERISEGVNE